MMKKLLLLVLAVLPMTLFAKNLVIKQTRKVKNTDDKKSLHGI